MKHEVLGSRGLNLAHSTLASMAEREADRRGSARHLAGAAGSFSRGGAQSVPAGVLGTHLVGPGPSTVRALAARPPAPAQAPSFPEGPRRPRASFSSFSLPDSSQQQGLGPGVLCDAARPRARPPGSATSRRKVKLPSSEPRAKVFLVWPCPLGQE